MSARDLGPCVYCGRPAKEEHHFTSCMIGHDDYLDPAARLSLCIPCHKAEHAAWRAVGLDAFDHPLLARTCRVTWTVGRLVGVDHPASQVLRPIHPVLVVIRDAVAELVGAEVRQ